MIKPKIQATNIELTDAIRTYVEDKLRSAYKIVPQDQEILAEVEVERTTNHHENGEVYRAEVNFTIAGNLYRVEATKDDLYAAIDKMKDELVRELRKGKTKRTDMIRKGGAKMKGMLRKFGF